MAPATTEVPGANVRVEVEKESVPVAEKKPLMESAWATAALLTAKAAASTARRLSIVVSGGATDYVRGRPRSVYLQLSYQAKRLISSRWSSGKSKLGFFFSAGDLHNANTCIKKRTTVRIAAFLHQPSRPEKSLPASALGVMQDFSSTVREVPDVTA
jgi:hypothetical protein